MNKILVISLSNIKYDARVKRQIDFIKKDHDITVAAFDIDLPEGLKFIKLTQPKLTSLQKIKIGALLFLRFFKAASDRLYDYPELKGLHEKLDLIIINDIETISLAQEIKGTARLLFDAHEYFPRQFEDKFFWRLMFQPLFKHLCKVNLSKVDAMTTIGEGIAREYELQYGIKPTVVNNAAPYQEIEKVPASESAIHLVHHGIAIPSRRLELMIEMMEHLDDRFHLHLMLLSPPTANLKTRRYLSHLKELSQNNTRIKFIEPVKSDEIVKAINKYDIGIILVPPINFNYKNGLGNKFFDFIQSRLAMAIGPIPEMASVVKKYQLGVVSKDFTPKGLAMEVNALTKQQIDLYKENSGRAAKEINAQNNKIIFSKIVDQLLSYS